MQQQALSAPGVRPSWRIPEGKTLIGGRRERGCISATRGEAKLSGTAARPERRDAAVSCSPRVVLPEKIRKHLRVNTDAPHM